MKAWVWIAALAAGMALATPVVASDAGYLYGRIITDEGDTFQGQLRWGKEEAFWDDIFNATKVENENLRYVDDDVIRKMRRTRRSGWDVLFNFGDRDDEFTHVFAARFGDLKRIDIGRRDKLTVTFRNGEQLALDGGSNDVGARITVMDPDEGKRRLRWRDIESIEFMATPEKLEKKLGEPLYGTVRTSTYEFEGNIQWDHDETLSVDELDGDVRDGDISIEFGDIAKIRKHRRGALVTLLSGTELYVTGSNDVNRGNRGVVVKVPDLGSVKVGWEDFEEVTFVHPAPSSGRSYADFGEPKRLKGVVETRGDHLSGDIVFDLDEVWDLELLHGSDGDTEYLIPFREIQRIERKGRYRANVILRAGDVIELERSQDVSRKNDGLLVFTSSSRPQYIAWEDVEAIRFE